MNTTIIIPVYNTEKYLKRCFNSLIVEDCKYILKHHIKVLFVNDGSTDASQEVIDALKSKYDFVESVYQINKGLAEARNKGIKQINTRYYALLDSDDWLDMQQFCEVYDKLLEQELDVISFGLSYYNENDEFTGHRTNQNVTYNEICTGVQFLQQGYQPSSACLFIYNREFIINNDLWYYPGITQEDVEHTFRMMLGVKKGLFLENKVYKYYRRSDSDTMTTSKDRVQKYLSDSIKVAYLISVHLNSEDIRTNKKLIELTQKTYNSVVWNLLWRFLSKPKEVDSNFKLQCIKELKEKNLYPIKGPLKTKFQRLTRVIMNIEFLLKWVVKL